MSYVDEAKSLIAEVLGQEETSIADDDSIHSLAAWDSINHLRLVLSIEQRVDKQLQPAEFLTLTSVSGVADCLKINLEGRS